VKEAREEVAYLSHARLVPLEAIRLEPLRQVRTSPSGKDFKVGFSA
jgi:hypothetical protein